MIKFFRDKYQHIIIICALVFSAAMTCLRYQASVFRLIYAIKDFGVSVAYYFAALFEYDIPVTVTELPGEEVLKLLPFDVDEILRKLDEMWDYVFNGECFMAYLVYVLDILNMIAIFLLPGILLCVLLTLLIRKVLLTENTDQHGEISPSIEKIEQKTLPRLYKIKDWFVELYGVFVASKAYTWIFILLWGINFNLLTILCEALAYYFYFAFSLDFGNLFSIQIVKLLLDVVIMLSGAPALFWAVITYVIICFVRRKIGYQRLDHRERLDRDLIARQPLILMFTGTMGTGKTTENTSFCISVEIMFREKAFDLMFEIASRYPNFPWINLEDELRRAIDFRQIVNLTTCRRFIEKKKRRFLNASVSEKIFGYNVDVYRYHFDDNLVDEDIWKSLEDYACLYFIYVIESSLLVTNYSIRVDSILDTVGNFPLWNTELFRNTPGESAARTRRSHILDYDMLRMGSQMVKDNPNRNTFEFGILSMSEFAKERGNQLTLQDVKKKDDQANQKNDLLIYSLKMARHKATICGYPFVFFLADEQRDNSLNADTRELMNIINIDTKNPTELLMPCFFVEDLLHEIIYPRFVNFFAEYRFTRGDTCLLMYLLKNGVSTLHNQYKRIYNLYGCNVLDVSIKSGKEGAEEIKERLHILHKKVYSDRFSTDCYRGFSEPELEKAEIGLDDYREYAETVPSLDELHYQNSYFIRDLEEINFREKESENNGKK